MIGQVELAHLDPLYLLVAHTHLAVNDGLWKLFNVWTDWHCTSMVQHLYSKRVVPIRDRGTLHNGRGDLTDCSALLGDVSLFQA